jgi:hypothetical protein
MEDSGMFSRNHLNERFFKIISIFGFFLLMVVLTILVQVEPASSYEFSIYDAYSWYLLLDQELSNPRKIIGFLVCL